MSFWLLNLTSLFFFVSLIFDLIFWLKIWEDRDFNFKRFYLFLRETKKGKSLLFGRVGVIRWFLILIYFFSIFVIGFDLYYHILVFGFYFFVFSGLILSVLNREIEYPGLSLGNILIVFFSFSVITLLFIFAPLDRFLWMLLLQKMLPLIFAFSLFLVAMVSDFTKDVIINKAAEKIEKHKELLTIVVIGSYGRGSTKEFISRILSEKYNVLSTRLSFTNSLGIAKTILSELSQKKQIFIAEIDDYSRDDVSQICALIKPKILVVTGINSQKLSLFGNMENIINSKKQAMISLDRDGIGIINANNEYISELTKKIKIKKFLYSSEKNLKSSDIQASSIKESRLSISFNVMFLRKKYNFSNIKLLGKQNIENLLPGIFIGIYTGIDTILIRKALSTLRPLPETMYPKISPSKTILIDDTHNANINSVLKALTYMKIFKGKKVLVLEPLHEIGKGADKVHEMLGFEIGRVCDFLFLTNSDYIRSIEKGIVRAKKECDIQVASPTRVIKFVRELGKDDVVVFEGKESRLSFSGIKASDAL